MAGEVSYLNVCVFEPLQGDWVSCLGAFRALLVSYWTCVTLNVLSLLQLTCLSLSFRVFPCLSAFKYNRSRVLRERFYVPRLMGPPPADFKDYYFKNPYNRNLVKNPSGKDGKLHWTIEENGGNQFKVETSNPCAPGSYPCDGMKEEGYETCWATSYGWCVKHQLIDLLKEGCIGSVLDQIKPDIYISEWTAARGDCGSTYKLHVQLLGEDKQEVLDQFSKQRHVEQWEGGHWEKIEHKFQNYPPGVRYIWYQHSGKDLQFWAGHYGPKFGGSTVRFQFREQTK